MKKRLYLGGGLLESQLLWILPVAAGYCKEIGVEEIIVEALPKRLCESRSAAFVKRNSITLVSEVHIRTLCLNHKSSILARLVRRIRGLLLAFQVSRAALLKCSSWDQCQLFHAVWDSALVVAGDRQYTPNFNALWVSGVQCLSALERAKWLRSIGVCHSILGHTVYATRALKVGFCLDKTFRLFAHAGDSIYSCPTTFDQASSIHVLSHWSNLFEHVSMIDAEGYFHQRRKGISAYDDASRAAALPLVATPGRGDLTNVVFLHVFRDSPFNYIDQNRVFADYMEWFRQSLRIIAASNESWSVRVHPSSLRWGENPRELISAILKSLDMRSVPANINIEYEPGSNLEVFKSARRIVTYAGTSALEACCYGRRPITISMTTPESFSKALVNKPCTVQEYRELLLAPSSSSLFDLQSCQVSDARRLLYAVEKLIPLTPHIGSLPLYRGDTLDQFELGFLSTVQSLDEATMNFLSGLGKNLASGKLSATYSVNSRPAR
ncbi:hypothetical protein KBY99_01630 [Cyanobium sp. Maggiore-St4-Cus]|uniref:hypothetical protein n=1 Tax=Cyanobium sp. Maggiore-St4-Cus TaxID=2823717 RepID=UPI0020CB9349|nr:hypothetical protein [Cyanobium sp. Maggiore-St4-Cus]MCP9787677.1 hypothetical protein [Cyanobium sp. Maggiore-St4-Cus]